MPGGIRIPEYAYLIISKDLIEANGNKATLVIGQEKVFVNANYQGDENFENEVSGVLKHVRTIHSMVGGNEEDFKFTVLKNVSSDQESRIRMVVIKILEILKIEEGINEKLEKVDDLLKNYKELLLDVWPQLLSILQDYRDSLERYKEKKKKLEEIHIELLDPIKPDKEAFLLRDLADGLTNYLKKLHAFISDREKEIKKEIEKIGF
ncbi:hypothetical protein [Thermococcus sp.]|uniref:hypothetical protein n=1 Tax=Thermococcus sp. TaxID=35749 RepID=UPI00261A4829|nr:hypothetical protein [Thermococcus sp.]